MIVHQELKQHGDEYELRNYYDTDDAERANWERVQAGKGFIYEGGKLVGREIAQIPVDEAMRLESLYDLDYLAFSRNNDKAALRRLLMRFPHWRSSGGGF